MLAIISDLHSNIEALDEVFRHMERLEPERLACLGDIIGYGPDPHDCLKRLRSHPLFTFSLKGNHEAALLDEQDAVDFNDKARAALRWTRDRINEGVMNGDGEEDTWEFIDALPERVIEDRFHFVHGSPRDPIREYVLPRDARNPTKLRVLFDHMEKPICFVGHSHIPGVYTEGGEFYTPGELDGSYPLRNGERILVNVGSVGQPRDGDVRSCYVTVDDDAIRFHRVEYDYRRVKQKILDTEGLPDYLGERLERGR